MNMHRSCLSGVVACVAFVLVQAAGAAPFDPVFRVLRYQGDCLVAPPSSTNFAPAKGSKAYPLGTTVRTGPASSALIAFSDGNECLMDGRTALVVEGDADDRTNRTVRLLTGRVTVELDAQSKYTNRVDVRTPLATASSEKSRFDVVLSGSNDLFEVRCECLSGFLRVSASEFEVPIMQTADTVLLSGDPGHAYLRARTLKGAYAASIRNDAAEIVPVPMKNNSIVKVWQRYSEPERVRGVVNRVYTPEGMSATNFSYTLQGPAFIAPMSEPPPETP
jgi:hypothetical protein